MFKKYLLLSCAVAMLSACGGGKDLDYGTVIITTPTPTPEPDDVQYQYTFESEAELADWTVEWEKRGEEDSELYYHDREKALGIKPWWGQDPNHRAQDTWTGNNWDYVEAYVTMDEPMDLHSGTIYMSIFYPESQLQSPWGSPASAHHLGTQYILIDVDGNRAMLEDMGTGTGWLNSFDQGSSANKWLRSQETPVGRDGTWFNLGIEVGFEAVPDDEEAGFDLSNVVSYGVRFNFAFEFPENADPDSPTFNEEIYGDGIPQHYLFIDNVAAYPYQGDGPLPTPEPPAPGEPPEFELPVYLDQAEAGFSQWNGWSGVYNFASTEVRKSGTAAISAEYDAASWGAALQIGAADSENGIDVSGYSTFHFSAWVPFGVGDSDIQVKLCDVGVADCGAIDGVTVTAVENTWTDFSIALSEFPSIATLKEIRIKNASDDGKKLHYDEIGFDLIEQDPNLIRIPTNQGWRTGGGAPDDPAYSSAGVSYSPTAKDQQLVYDFSGPADLHGHPWVFEITVDQDFLDSGSAVQPFAQLKSGTWPGEWDCYLNNEDLSVDGVEYECILDTVDAEDNPYFNLSADDEIQIGVQVKGDSVAGTVTISSLSVYIPPASDLPLTEGWRTSSDLGLSYTGGVSYSPTAADDQLVYDIDGPENLEGAEFIFTIAVSQEFIDSGANLQPFAQEKTDYTGEWDCWIPNEQLTVDGAQYSCVLDGTEAPFNIGESEGIQVGVQAKGTTVAGTVTITDVQINYAGPDMSSGWSTTGSSDITYDAGTVNYSPTADNEQLYFDVAGPDNLEGATVVFTLAVDQAYIDSGSNVQPFAQLTAGGDAGVWDCWINNADLTLDGAEHNCVISVSDFNLAEGSAAKVGIQSKGSAVTGSITVQNVRIIYAD